MMMMMMISRIGIAPRLPCYTAIPSVCLSVCHTRIDCIKTTEYIIEILLLSDRLIILVFRHQESLRKSDGP